MKKRFSKAMLLGAAMVFGACHTSQLESQDGFTFKAKQPTNIYYVTKYTYQNRKGKVYPVKLDYKGRAYYTPETLFAPAEIYLPEIGRKINPAAYDDKAKKGEWKKNLPELLK